MDISVINLCRRWPIWWWWWFFICSFWLPIVCGKDFGYSRFFLFVFFFFYFSQVSQALCCMWWFDFNQLKMVTSLRHCVTLLQSLRPTILSSLLSNIEQFFGIVCQTAQTQTNVNFSWTFLSDKKCELVCSLLALVGFPPFGKCQSTRQTGNPFPCVRCLVVVSSLIHSTLGFSPWSAAKYVDDFCFAFVARAIHSSPRQHHCIVFIERQMFVIYCLSNICTVRLLFISMKLIFCPFR